jgi:hypothetical protein
MADDEKEAMWTDSKILQFFVIIIEFLQQEQ